MSACNIGNIDVVCSLLDEIISSQELNNDIWFNILDATEFNSLCNKEGMNICMLMCFVYMDISI